MDILNQTDEVRLSINRLEERIRKLNHQQGSILGHAVVSPRQRRDLEVAIDEIKEHISHLRPRIREIDLAVRQYERTEDNSSAQVRIRKNQCEQLKRKLEEVLFMFNQSQNEYKRRVSRKFSKILFKKL